MDKVILEKMANFCSRSEHCEQDVLDKLRSCEICIEEKNEIVKWLVQENFIDNARYAKAYVRDKFRFNRWGRKKIWIMLKAKKIDDELIQNALNEIDEKKYIDALKELIENQRKKINGKSEYEIKGKLYNFALARGFESSIISELL